ncbi:hypothetical protein DFH07DRAFT_781250 [Mycena maculata]|uniref:Uncharacterized protein n=1 Tax=Mycena maculata TaxID=230809 RepID=A0AAD7HYT8_9AGAR|nr:hypothetical protein DFH07DRAFT_781250 [Mycena maculata]
MFKFLFVVMLAAAQLGSLRVVASTAVATGPFDTSNFFTSQVNLQSAANVAALDSYNSFPANASELGPIASHIKACSDAFDAAIISIAAISPLQFPSGPLFSESDAQTLNTTYVPSTQQTILGHLNSLQDGMAFFESVNNAPLFLTSFCHWVGTLAEENNVFFNLLIGSAPADYQPYWEQLQSEAVTAYDIWLNEDGFNCEGRFKALGFWIYENGNSLNGVHNNPGILDVISGPCGGVNRGQTCDVRQCGGCVIDRNSANHMDVVHEYNLGTGKPAQMELTQKAWIMLSKVPRGKRRAAPHLR